MLIQAMLLVLLAPTPDALPLNAAVGETTIKQTICKPGWTATIRPPASYTTKLKLKQLRERGLTGKAADFEENHKMPLALGGHPTDPRNLEPEPWPEAKQRDVVERRLNRLVCSRPQKLKLRQAQIEILDWRAAYAKYVGPLK